MPVASSALVAPIWKCIGSGVVSPDQSPPHSNTRRPEAVTRPFTAAMNDSVNTVVSGNCWGFCEGLRSRAIPNAWADHLVVPPMKRQL